jgi:NAD(P)-dependent dehydrogenase (short-subunit alcohol dehydrogenase family)
MPPSVKTKGRRLEGSSMLVIGPAHPLAVAIARAADEEGARVAVVGQDPAGESADLLQLDGYPQSEGAVDDLFDGLIDRLGVPASIVIVTGCAPVHAIHDVRSDEWEDATTSPLRIAFWIVRRAILELLATGAAGRFVFVLRMTSAEGPGNAILEGAFHSFVRSLTREYGRRGLAFNMVVSRPGPGSAGAFESTARYALFLASSRASFVTGQSLWITDDHTVHGGGHG